MSRYSGRMAPKGSEKIRGNKGVAVAARDRRRHEAKRRQERYNFGECTCQGCAVKAAA